MNFSVLISVYFKENSEYFDASLASIFNQTYRPTEVILVKDGLLTKELDDVIQKYKQNFPEQIKVIELQENVGLGKALNIGLKNCSYDLVARMDSDDVCCSNRFELQIETFKQDEILSILGGQILEFDEEMKTQVGFRSVPLTDSEIKKYAKNRNPFNHMTVMFKKEAVQRVGNYKPLEGFEDYYLWLRMIKNGEKTGNLDEQLVYVRAGESLLDRRGGKTYFVRNFRARHRFHNETLIPFPYFIKTVGVGFVFLLPQNIRKLFYTKILRGKNKK